MEQLTAPLQKRTVAFQKYLLGRRRIVETVLSKINLPNCPPRHRRLDKFSTSLLSGLAAYMPM